MSYKKLKVIAIILSILIVIGLIAIGVVFAATNTNNTTTALAENSNVAQNFNSESSEST